MDPATYFYDAAISWNANVNKGSPTDYVHANGSLLGGGDNFVISRDIFGYHTGGG